jgi:hypothetical protein
MPKKIYNAIVFFDPNTKIKPRKYRNISNPIGFSNFCLMSGAKYINFYIAKSKEYSHRVNLDYQYP